VSAIAALSENPGTTNVNLDLYVECVINFTLESGPVSASWESWGGCYRVDKRE